MRTALAERLRTMRELVPGCSASVRPMSELTTWRVGGPALVLDAHTRGELSDVLEACREMGLDYRMLGRGSNLLVVDEGTDSPMIRLSGRFRRFTFEGERLLAGAGAPLPPLAGAACMRGLEGLAFATGIPGTMGGAIYMNAGAYGGSVSDVVARVECLDSTRLRYLEMEPDACLFDYRSSVFQRRRELLVTGVEMLLKPESHGGEQVEAASEILRERRRRFPLRLPSCGSVFRRTQGAPPPGKLIDDCGLKGTCVGGARVSGVHANFIVNTGGATAADILELIELVRDRVKRMTGVLLTEEVELVER